MSFPLVGNSRIADAITNFLKERRIPHAMIIEGDIGTGRHTLAWFLARACVCGGSNIPCGSCKQCSIGEQNHPDIAVISLEDGKKNISVNQIRELRAEAFIKPHMAARRVFIIDFADTLNIQSQNALLKILEEPPESCVFILIAESKASFLDTVLSRCILFSLSVPSYDTALQYIKSATDAEEEVIKAALQESRNNIGVALSAISGSKGSKVQDAAKEFLECFIRRDSWGMLSITVPFEKKRVEAENFVKALKVACAEALRNNLNNNKAKIFNNFYEELSLREKSLVSNINLGLFFSSLVSRAEKIASKR